MHLPRRPGDYANLARDRAKTCVTEEQELRFLWMSLVCIQLPSALFRLAPPRMAVKVPSMLRAASLLFICPQFLWSASPQAAIRGFFDQHCLECHDSQVKKGGLDLSGLNWTPETRENFDLWVKVHDRAQKGEMPPKKKDKP